jgi:hypothetical protein
MRQVQPETLPKNSNFSSCLQNIKLKNNTNLRTVFVSATEHCFSFISYNDRQPLQILFQGAEETTPVVCILYVPLHALIRSRSSGALMVEV